MPNTIDLMSAIPHSNKKWTQRKASAVKLIAVHHEGGIIRPEVYDEIEAIKQMASYHIKKNWGSPDSPSYAPTTPYHFCIGRSGKVYKLNNVTDVTWHARKANPIAVGVLLQGNLEKQSPSTPQLIALDDILNAFTSDDGLDDVSVGIGDVYGHGELNGTSLSLKYMKMSDFGNYTSCPGSLLPYLKGFRAKGWIVDIPTDKDDGIADSVGEFSDLPDGQWFTVFAKTLIDAGVMRGYEDKTWRPAEPVTRAELSKVIIGAILKADEIKNIYKEKSK